MPSRRGFEQAERTDWSACIEKAGTGITGELARLPDDAWLNVVEGTWTIKDVVDHLVAWSDYLLDEVEALARGDADVTQAVDIDEWNAIQIAARRDWPVERVRAAWEATAKRALYVVAQLPADDIARRWRVAWTDEPVSPADLLNLWLVHIEQHCESLVGWYDRRNGREAKE